MDEESTDNSLWDFLSKAGETAGNVYTAANRPKAPPAASAGQRPSQPAWLIPVIIGGALLLFGVILVAALGGRR